MWICECVHAFMHVCVHLYVYMCMCICACVYVYMYMCICACVYVYVYMCMCICACVCVYVYVYMCMCICACVYVHVYMCMCICVCVYMNMCLGVCWVRITGCCELPDVSAVNWNLILYKSKYSYLLKHLSSLKEQVLLFWYRFFLYIPGWPQIGEPPVSSLSVDITRRCHYTHPPFQTLW